MPIAVYGVSPVNEVHHGRGDTAVRPPTCTAPGRSRYNVGAIAIKGCQWMMFQLPPVSIEEGEI